MTERTNIVVSSRRFHFGLGALLLAIAGIAAVLGNIRLGYDRGYSAGQEQWRSETVHPVVYNVGDILDHSSGQPDFDRLIDALVTTVEPASWQETGGPGTIQGIGQNQLIIAQTAAIHAEIQAVLKSIRDGRRKRQANEQR